MRAGLLRFLFFRKKKHSCVTPPESAAAAILAEITINAHVSDLRVRSPQGQESLSQRRAAVKSGKNASGAASGGGGGRERVRESEACRMDGWMDGRVDNRWMDGLVDGWKDTKKDG